VKRAIAVVITGAAMLMFSGRAAGESGRPLDPDRLAENEGRAVAASVEYADMVHGGPLRDAPAARLAAAAQAAAIAPAASPGGNWREVGPTPYDNDDPKYPGSLGPFGIVSGRVASLAVDPSDANVVYAGAAGGGVWKTTDGGDHWKPVADDLPSMAIGALAVDPQHPQTVFAGTGDASAGGDAYSGSGIYRSRNGGTTWERVNDNLAAASGVFHIEIAGGRVFVATTKGLFRSIDGGDSYQNVNVPTNAAGTAPDAGEYANFISDVRVKPGGPDEVTAAVGWRAGAPQAPGNGLYRSTAGGAPGSFHRLTTSGLGLPNEAGDPLGRISLAYASGPGQDHDVMWAVVQDAGKQNGDTLVSQLVGANYTVLNGVFRSGDDGATWDLKALPEQLIAAPGTAMTVRSVLLYSPGIQSWFNQWIDVDPGNADTVLLGLEEIYKTTLNANGPGPAVWEAVGRYSSPCADVPTPTVPPCPPLISSADFPSGLTIHPDQHAVALARTSNATRAYVGNDGGVWRQDATSGAFDNDHWVDLNATLATLQPYQAAMSTDGTIYFGLQDNGIGRTTGPRSGSSISGGDGMDVAVHPQKSDIAYGAGAYGSLGRTIDGGVTWTDISPSLTHALFVTPFDLDPVNPLHMVVAAREIYQSGDVQGADDGGWIQVLDLGAAPDGVDNSSSAVAVRGTAAYIGWCGHCNVFADAGGDVTKFRSGIATSVAPGCTPEPNTAKCWHVSAAHGLPTRIVTGLAIDESDPRTVFVTLGLYSAHWYDPKVAPPGFGAGHLFVSHDAGETFTDVSGNLPDTPATSVALRGTDVIVGTDDGVFVAPRADGGVGAFARLGSSLVHAPVWSIRLDPTGNHLVAATHGRGIWVLDFTATRNAQVPIGVIAATGRSDPAVAPLALALALLVRALNRAQRESRRRPALFAR
jgi:photosystem II stability/assembly factor-like uncharacterized protein